MQMFFTAFVWVFLDYSNSKRKAKQYTKNPIAK